MSKFSRRGFLAGLAALAAAPMVTKVAAALPPEALHRAVLARKASFASTLYCNRTIRCYLDVNKIRDCNVLLNAGDYAGMSVVAYRSIPIRVVDKL